jgi:hypothetical protein
MTPISDLIARIVSRVLDKRQRDNSTCTRNEPPVPDDPELMRQADKWAEPETDTPLFDAPDATAAWPRDLFEPGRKP